MLSIIKAYYLWIIMIMSFFTKPLMKLKCVSLLHTPGNITELCLSSLAWSKFPKMLDKITPSVYQIIRGKVWTNQISRRELKWSKIMRYKILGTSVIYSPMPPSSLKTIKIYQKYRDGQMKDNSIFRDMTLLVTISYYKRLRP